MRKRLESFRYAWEGLVVLVRDEHNARIHLIAAAIAIAMGFILHISPMEWAIIVLCICVVIATEAMNTALEAICNRVSMERDDLIKRAKDCAAASVLITAIMSIIIAGIIFIPKLISLGEFYFLPIFNF